MIASVIASFVMHFIRYFVIVKMEAEVFREILDWLILIVYTVVTFAFLPLFVSIMTLLEITLPEVYDRIKCQLISMFSILIVFLAARLYLYADLKFIRAFFKDMTIYSVIPFYLTELVIALSLSYVLYVSGPMDREGNRQSEVVPEEGIVLVRKEEDGRLVILPKEEQDSLKNRLIINGSSEIYDGDGLINRSNSNVMDTRMTKIN